MMFSLISLVLTLLLAGVVAFAIYSLVDDLDSNTVNKRLQKITQATYDSKKHNVVELSLSKRLEQLLNPITVSVYEKVSSKDLRKLLLEAGRSAGLEDIMKLLEQKIILATIGFTFAVVNIIFILSKMDIGLPIKLLIFIIIPLSFFRLPDIQLKQIAKRRANEIRDNLPDALDLLTVCVEAGLSLDSSFVRVSDEQARMSPILSNELTRVNRDIRSGIPRQQSYRNLAERNQVADLRTFVALLIQTDKLGTSIAQSLRVFSDTMRTKRRQRAETLAAKASIKMVIPLVFFVLPSMFVVLLGPAALSFMKAFGGAGK